MRRVPRVNRRRVQCTWFGRCAAIVGQVVRCGPTGAFFNKPPPEREVDSVSLGIVVPLYRGSATRFRAQIEDSSLIPLLCEQYRFSLGSSAPPAEVRSWERSLQVLASDLHDAGLDGVEVLIEYRLPLCSKRADVILCGTHPKTGGQLGSRHGGRMRTRRLWRAAASDRTSPSILFLYFRLRGRDRASRRHPFGRQFRLGGSRAYELWVLRLLGLEPGGPVLWEGDESFTLSVAKSPSPMEDRLRSYLDQGYGARMAAGYCWKWSEPIEGGGLVEDVHIGDWQRPWNNKKESSHA